MEQKESSLLKNWQIKIALLTSIVMPTITATGAYYNLSDKMTASKTEYSEKVSSLELKITQSFADKASLQRIDERTQKIQNDITELATIVKRRLR